MNPRWIKFVDEYLKTGNIAQSYHKAGYKSKGAVASAAGNRLLKNVHLQAYLTKRRSEMQSGLEITQDRIAHEYARIAFSNIKNHLSYGPQGVDLKDSTELTDDQLAAVSEVSQTVTREGGSIKFKLWDKSAALGGLTKMFGLEKAQTLNVNVGFGTHSDEEASKLWEKILADAKGGKS
jgi:phage terminase small subunit